MFRIIRFPYLTGIFSIIMLICSCQAEIPSRKYNGISLVASRDSLHKQQVDPILATNTNTVALMPYAFLRDNDRPEVIFNSNRQWFGERAEGIEQAIIRLQERDLKIMLKPHLWIRNGKFTGDLKFSSEKDWLQFEESYREYILFYAQIAEEHGLELFCIGTELYTFVHSRRQFWTRLVAQVRQLYHGKLIYAENWDKADKVQIWQYLDYIGVDAYFPLSEQASPGVSEIKKGWQQHKRMLKELSSHYYKPVIFTEYGYRSRDQALKEPWNSESNPARLNMEIQARALQVIYEEFWPENWFHGGFLWKWHQYEKSGGPENDRFTPQNKPAEAIVREYYARFRN